MSDMGTVYQRKSDKRWVGRYLATNPLTGKKKPKYVYSSKPGIRGEQEVRRKLYDLITKIESGDFSDLSTITVSGWLEKYIEVYCANLAQTTLEGYNRYIEDHINPVLGEIRLRDILPIHIQSFYNHERTAPRYRRRNVNGKMVPIIKNGKPAPLMKDGKPVIGYSETTILQQHSILKRAFSKAVGDGLLGKNPCDAIDAPSPEEFKPDIPTEEEFNLILEKLRGHRIEALILIAGMCGLRRAELAGIDWDENIDWDKGIIKIIDTVVPTSTGNLTKKPKNTKSEREFTIPSAIMHRLKELKGTGKIFTRIDGKEYNPGSISRMFKEFLEQNGLRHIRLHDLRHFNATMMLKHGISERESQERLGHSNGEMTKKYQHILKEMDQLSAEKLNTVYQQK